jgi:hypothetical protein
VILPASDLAVGPNRFLVALLGQGNRLITNADLRLRFFKVVDATSATFKSEAQPHYYGSGLGDRGVYVAQTTFDEAGAWGVEVSASRDGQALGVSRVAFEVKPRSATPALGAAIPLARVPTATDPAEVEKICSARPTVDQFHGLSMSDAIAAGKPFLLLFASPGFCQTQTCGPSLEVLQRLAQAQGDRLNYLHVEVYQDPHLGAPGLKPVPAVLEWKLPSEPWLFLVDRQGKLFDKFEGGITFEETAPAVDRLVQAQG